ncbi:Gfo/Idh/MocA family protein [Autumnicola edwardsiae]|uniref:Gfo/Idh/MocA family oxidoreductase n=1 Tax=Autumnicola edwardsiae TaxID=3075594 RepID=A0ABU3CWA2_9FLAO|nr:Gfo/Idh/MocA family oxidoreductase [Zunongwangia sp. F297]MDT0650643.1 Gfo/Idh/MocA family oxidoreductase [Zunongwangia sp. F297]
MNKLLSRRSFIITSTVGGIGMGIAGGAPFGYGFNLPYVDVRVGIIGLDTSHSVAFTKMLNDTEKEAQFRGYRIVAAYPHGSRDIESSVRRIPEYTKEVKEAGVEIVESIKDLLEKVDVVLLETNDGRLHLEQAMEVFKAGKPVFIDKPMAGSLSDVIAIFNAAKRYNVPVFSSSSLRYAKNAQAIRKGELIGKVLGADTFSPAKLEITHPDLFWYGIHGVEILFTVMGTGCESVISQHTEDMDVVVGIWQDGRIGTFRGGRSGKMGYGGNAFGEEGVAEIGPYKGYKPLLTAIIEFFNTGKAPVSSEETQEIYTFMEAADESKRRGGKPVYLKEILPKP